MLKLKISLIAKKNSSIEQRHDDDSWSIVATIDRNGHLNMTNYSQIEKNYNYKFTIHYQNINKD